MNRPGCTSRALSRLTDFVVVMVIVHIVVVDRLLGKARRIEWPSKAAIHVDGEKERGIEDGSRLRVTPRDPHVYCDVTIGSILILATIVLMASTQQPPQPTAEELARRQQEKIEEVMNA